MGNMQLTCNIQHASMQHGQHATCNMQHATCIPIMHPQHATCNMGNVNMRHGQHVQHATYNMGNMQPLHAMQQAAGIVGWLHDVMNLLFTSYLTPGTQSCLHPYLTLGTIMCIMCANQLAHHASCVMSYALYNFHITIFRTHITITKAMHHYADTVLASSSVLHHS